MTMQALRKGDRVMINGKICTVEKFYPETINLMAAVKVKEHARVVYMTEVSPATVEIDCCGYFVRVKKGAYQEAK